ncbi:MAG: DUF3014 domain-containing protein [Gammaproteobacteria bacterium]|nr:DUF3014 domain-containing protein [Gammaproteobacteria bacterium]
MSKLGLWVVAGIAVFTLLYLVYLAATFEAPTGTTTVIVPATSMQSVVEPAPVITLTLPQTRLQSPEEPPAVAATPVIIDAPVEVEIAVPVVEGLPGEFIELPSLNDSDDFVFEGLRALQNGAALIRVLADEQLIRSIVVFVDNINRGEFPQTSLPYKRIEPAMSVRNIDANLYVMEAAAHERFNQLIDTFVAVDTDQAMILYRTLQPLFQQAYAEIGSRNVDFDDTLRSAINAVLRSPNVEGPYQLVKPSVMFLYADASIENMEEMRKQLIRIGPQNTEKLKAKLRQFSEKL